MTTTVVVSAGTYHLPFDRLVRWMEPWVASNPDVRVVMQHGPGRPLPGAENHSTLPYSSLMALCADADAVVLQGGAGGVMDMRALARIPIVVPRVPVANEVVDDHQLIFSQKASELGVILRATTAEELWRMLDDVIHGRLGTRSDRPEPTPGVAAIEALLAELPERVGRVESLCRLIRTIRDIALRR